MTDDRSIKKPGADKADQMKDVGDDRGEGGEADIKPELGINDGRPDDADETPSRDLSGS